MTVSPLDDTLRRRHLPALDGLRAISVFTVIVYHFGTSVPGDLGVSAFFVLSGFLITWLLLKEYDATGTISLAQFFRRRVLRIFPAYYAFLAASFVVDNMRAGGWPPGLGVSALTYTVNYYNAFHGHPSTSIAHAWSLGIEEQFYLLWPMLFWLLLRGGIARARLALGGLVAAVVAWRCLLYLKFHVDAAYVYNAFDTRFDNLAIGCLLATCVGTPAFRSTAERLGRVAVAPYATLALLLFSRIGVGATYHYTLGFTVNAVLLAVFIVQMLLLYQSRAWSWLESPVARYLGVISYPLYLWHIWALGVGHHVRVAGIIGEFIAGVTVAILLASGSYYIIERPFLTLKHRVPKAARQPSPVPLQPAARDQRA